ncbi:MAG: EI24 domain-containing protein [Bradymonadaceae bacterium]
MAGTEHPAIGDIREATQRSAPVRLFSGGALPLKAARFLAGEPSLWPHVAVPALINAALFITAVYYVVLNADAIIAQLWARPPVEQWWDWVMLAGWYGAVAIIGLLLLVVTYMAVVLIGGLIATPFNDLLGEHAEQCLLADDAVPESDASLLEGALRAIVSTAAVLGTYLVVMVPILALNLVPGIGSIASTVLGTVVGAAFLSLEFCGGPLERRGLKLGERVDLLREHATIALGFGLGTTTFLWIPLVNFLTIPIAVVGGVMLSAGLADEPIET